MKAILALSALGIVLSGTTFARGDEALPPVNRLPGEGSTDADQSAAIDESAPGKGGTSDAIATDAEGNKTIEPKAATTDKVPMLSDRGDEQDRLDRAAKASSTEGSDGETAAERATTSSGSPSAGSSAAGRSGLDTPGELSAGSSTQPEDKEP